MYFQKKTHKTLLFITYKCPSIIKKKEEEEYSNLFYAKQVFCPERENLPSDQLSVLGSVQEHMQHSHCSPGPYQILLILVKSVYDTQTIT